MQTNQSSFIDQKIINDEELFPVKGEQSQSLLHRSICAITSSNKNEMRPVGSGVLISKNLVLTAAHTVFSKIQGLQYRNFKVYFEVDGVASRPYGVEAFRYLQQYKTCKKDRKSLYDFAILKLKEQVQWDEFLKISLGCFQCLMESNSQKFIQIFGYPLYERNYQPIGEQKDQFRLKQYGLSRKNRITMIIPSEHKICYAISTLLGQGGCPVVIEQQIVAIHMGIEREDLLFNVGRIIDISLLTHLEKWRKQINGDHFSISDQTLCSHFQPSVQDSLLKLKPKNSQNMESLNIFELYLRNQNLLTIKPSKYKNLTLLQLNNNKISSINVESNIYLKSLSLSNNKLSEIKLANNLNLVSLYLSHNKLQTIDISNNINLDYLSVSFNKLTEIDVKRNIKLTYLQCENNQIHQIDLTSNKKLTYLSLQNNLCTTIDATKNIHLCYLSLQGNVLSKVQLYFNAQQLNTYHLPLFKFCHQKSNLCEIQLKYNSADIIKCNQLICNWMKKYQTKGYNKYECKYSFVAIEE